MPLYYLIETPEGDQNLVLDLEGHEDCKVLEEGVTAPKVPGCERKNGKWKISSKGRTTIKLLETQNPKILARRIQDLEKRLSRAGL